MIKTIFPALTQIGVCTKSFGFKGDIKVNLLLDITERDKKPPFVWIKQYGKPVPYAIHELKILNKKEISIRLEDIKDETGTESLRNKAVFVESDIVAHYFKAPQMQQDVEGYKVITSQGENIGEVLAIQDIQGGHANLIVQTADNLEIMIPFVEAIVVAISDEEKHIKVELPEGLLDIYL